MNSRGTGAQNGIGSDGNSRCNRRTHADHGAISNNNGAGETAARRDMDRNPEAAVVIDGRTRIDDAERPNPTFSV